MQKKIGIVGGGQLGRMILQANIDFDQEIHILDPNPEAPCASLTPFFKVGKLTDFDAVYNFGKNLDIITIEIENVNAEALEKLQDKGKQVFPEPQVLRIIQDKRLQKQFYQKNNFPTAEFILIDEKKELEKHQNFLPAFLKLGKEGYDGKGVISLKSSEDFEKAFEKPSLLEKAVAIEKEISVIVARNPQGEIKSFPPVEMVFDLKYNLVDYLFAPADISEKINKEAQELAKTLIEKLDMHGILAVEMFLDKEGKLLINEIAPRPHNSGHHTFRANQTSQFAQHLRAILDLPLGNTQTLAPAAMVNILGAEGTFGEVNYKGIDKILRIEGTSVHLYGKKMTKPSRKMGHVIILENNLFVLNQKIKEVKNLVKNISQSY